MRLAKTLPLALATAASVALQSGPALAVGQDEASPTGKGLVGGTLLGGELALLVTAAVDPESTWLYLVTGVAGGVAGGVGGYYVEQSGSAQASMFLLAGGMALIIPTMVAVLSATAYEPPTDYTQDQGPSDEPLAEPPHEEDLLSDADGLDDRRPSVGGRSALTRRAGKGLHHPVPAALFGTWANGTLALSMPSLQISQVFTPAELHELGVEQKTELRMALFNFIF